MTTRDTAIPAAYLFLEKDGKFLIARRCNTGYEDGMYYLPAGHVEDKEVPTDAMIREAKEEIGIDLHADDLQLVHVSYRPRYDKTDNRVDFFFRATTWSGELQNLEPNKCDDLKWVSFDELPENLTHHVQDAIECIRDGVFYRELGYDYLREKGLYK